jgi:hypothetical protein
MKDAKDPRTAIPVSLLLPFLSVVFWKLDTRCRQLIHFGQQALMFFEEDANLVAPDGTPHVTQILLRQKHATERDRPWTYRRCFNAVFLIVGIAGFVAATSVLVFG